MNLLKALAVWSMFQSIVQVTLVSAILIYACIGVAETHADECAPLFSITDKQWGVLQQAYDTGAPYNLGNTMAAVVFRESTAGKYKINPESGDYGVAHINITTALVRTNTSGYWGKRELITRLVVDDQFNLDLALQELLYWKGETPSWKAMVSAYNQGWDYDTKSQHTMNMQRLTSMMVSCGELHMFNEEQPMTEDTVGDLVSSFNNDTMSLEPKVVGSFSGNLPYGTRVANSSKKPTMWSSFTTRLSRMWT